MYWKMYFEPKKKPVMDDEDGNHPKQSVAVAVLAVVAIAVVAEMELWVH